MTTRRFVVLDGDAAAAPPSHVGPRRCAHISAEDAARAAAQERDDLAASFGEATRRGDVIGALLRAAHGRVGHRASKVGGSPMDPAKLRRMRGRAFIEALVECAEHGVGEDSRLLAAMGDLVAVLDADVKPWAARMCHAVVSHRGPRTEPVRTLDLGKLRQWLADRDAEDAQDAPPSGWRRMEAV